MIIWITGASSGIGEALAYAFAREGAHLILSARNSAELERVKKNCIGASQVDIIPLDLGKHIEIFSIVGEAMKTYGKIDVLVNNAGLSQRSLTSETDFSVDKKLIDVNLLGTIAMTKAILPSMLAQRKGNIIVISSIMGKLGAPLRSSYAAAKHGLHGFFDTLRAETFTQGLKVLIVCPGFVRTNISMNALTATGKNQGTMDEATGKGLDPNIVAQKIIAAMKAGREEIILAEPRESFAVIVKRFFPKILSRIVRGAKTT